MFQEKQCRNCHSLDGQGGKRGPALDQVALRLTRDQLVRQVIQGGGNMPAYGKNLSPAETTALVAFLRDAASGGTGASARCCSGRCPGSRSSANSVLARPLSPHAHLLAHTWSLPVTSALVLTAVVYLRGWVRVRRALPEYSAAVWRPVAFLGGLLALWIAVGSPLRSLDEEMLVVHMVKHLLVMAVAAPLLLLGAPHLRAGVSIPSLAAGRACDTRAHAPCLLLALRDPCRDGLACAGRL